MLFIEAGARALQLLRSLDLAFGNEVRDLGEVAARPGEAHGERLRVHFLAPLRTPAATFAVDHRHARLRAAGMFLDETKRRHRPSVRSTRASAEVERGNVARILPQRVPGGGQFARASLADLPGAERSPGEVNEVKADRNAGDADDAPEKDGLDWKVHADGLQ